MAQAPRVSMDRVPQGGCPAPAAAVLYSAAFAARFFGRARERDRGDRPRPSHCPETPSRTEPSP